MTQQEAGSGGERNSFYYDKTQGLCDDQFRSSILRRSAEVEGAFFLPHLQKGMSLLDVGCGPASFTMGFARYVAPGGVIGVDISEVDIEKARAEAGRQGIDNLEFRVADAYELPFEGESFDAVWSSSVFEYLSDKAGALAEMRRVLKPGGVIGVQGTDWRGRLAGSSSPDADPRAFDERYMEVQYQSFLRRGVDFHHGAQLPRLLQEGGFVRGEVSAVYQKVASAGEGPAFIARSFVLPEENISYLEESGIATRDEILEMVDRMEVRARDPGVFAFLPLVGVVAWKE